MVLPILSTGLICTLALLTRYYLVTTSTPHVPLLEYGPNSKLIYVDLHSARINNRTFTQYQATPAETEHFRPTYRTFYTPNCQWAVQTSHGDFLCPVLQPGISRVFTSGADLSAHCPVTVEENRLWLNQLGGCISGLQSDITELAGAVSRLPQGGAFTYALLSPVVTVLTCISFTPAQSSCKRGMRGRRGTARMGVRRKGWHTLVPGCSCVAVNADNGR
jgi:hypothetical protein